MGFRWESALTFTGLEYAMCDFFFGFVEESNAWPAGPGVLILTSTRSLPLFAHR